MANHHPLLACFTHQGHHRLQRQTGGIAGQDGIGRTKTVQLLEQILFQLHVFRRCFDYVVAIFHRSLQVCVDRDVFQRRGCFFSRNERFFHQQLLFRLDFIQCLFQLNRIRIIQINIISEHGKAFRNTVPHRPCADNAYLFYHLLTSYRFSFKISRASLGDATSLFASRISRAARSTNSALDFARRFFA